MRKLAVLAFVFVFVQLGARALAQAEPGQALPAQAVDIEPRMARARALRSSGQPQAALYELDAAREEAPERPDVPEEQAWTYLNLGQPGAAREALGGDGAGSPAVRDAIARALRPVARSSTLISEESLGATRIGTRGTLTLALPHDLTLTAGGGFARVTATMQQTTYGAGGVELGWTSRHVYARAAGGVVQQGVDPRTGYDASAELGARAFDLLRVRVAVRDRPFLELAPTLATDEQAFYRGGSGGASAVLVASRYTVQQATVGLDLAPVPGGYLYASGELFAISDGNGGRSVSAGLGWNALAVLWPSGPLGATLMWNSYATGFSRATATYFAPDSFEVHDAGGELRLRIVDGFEVAASGAATMSLLEDRGVGAMYGASIAVDVDDFMLRVRGRVRDEIAFDSRIVWMSIGLRL